MAGTAQSKYASSAVARKENVNAAVCPFSMCMLFVFDVVTTCGGNVAEVVFVGGILLAFALVVITFPRC